jgi:CheY-like chemotaxis protein
MIEQPIILVVEDEAALRELLDRLLTQEGYRVIQAYNGNRALECIEQLRNSENRLPDLIISDNMMPVMDGLALVRHLRADTKLAQIKFILFSAAIAASSAPGSADLITAFIPKGFGLHQLLEVVSELISYIH